MVFQPNSILYLNLKIMIKRISNTFMLKNFNWNVSIKIYYDLSTRFKVNQLEFPTN